MEVPAIAVVDYKSVPKNSGNEKRKDKLTRLLLVCHSGPVLIPVIAHRCCCSRFVVMPHRQPRCPPFYPASNWGAVAVMPRHPLGAAMVGVFAACLSFIVRRRRLVVVPSSPSP